MWLQVLASLQGYGFSRVSPKSSRHCYETLMLLRTGHLTSVPRPSLGWSSLLSGSGTSLPWVHLTLPSPGGQQQGSLLTASQAAQLQDHLWLGCPPLEPRSPCSSCAHSACLHPPREEYPLEGYEPPRLKSDNAVARRDMCTFLILVTNPGAVSCQSRWPAFQAFGTNADGKGTAPL